MPTKHTMDDMVLRKKRPSATRPKALARVSHTHKEDKEEILVREESEKIEDEEKEQYLEEDISSLGLSRRPPREPLTSSSSRTKKRFVRWIFFSVITIAGLAYGMTFFTRVTTTITPKVKEENITASLRLNKLIAGSETVSTSTLSFDIFSVPKETAEEILETTGVEKVSKKASGDITIINLYSKTPVMLIANTRFQTPNGNIYRIKDQVLVPGMKSQTGTSTSLPGMLTVKVYADKAGASYNMKLADFTIPGFKGSPQYTKVYARSKTEITGGFEGDSPAVAEQALTLARERLKATILERLNSKKQSVVVPDESFIVPGAYGVTWNEKQTIKADDPKKLVLSVSAESTGLWVKKEALGTLLSGEEGYSIANTDSLTFSIDGDTSDLQNLKTGLLKVSGVGVFVATVPETAIKQAMLGKKKSDLQALFDSYPSVDKAKIMFFPSWAISVPNDPNLVTVELSEVPLAPTPTI